MNHKVAVIGVSLLLSFGGAFMASAQAANSVDIKIKGNLILNPPCELAATGGGSTIEVDFGDIVIRKMETRAANSSATTAAYQTPLPFSLKCDAEVGTAVRIGLKGNPASFNNEFLATDNPGVGIQFINLGKGTFIPNNTGMRRAQIIIGQEDSYRFYVVPIRNSLATDISSGAFESATASLIAEYE